MVQKLKICIQKLKLVCWFSTRTISHHLHIYIITPYLVLSILRGTAWCYQTCKIHHPRLAGAASSIGAETVSRCRWWRPRSPRTSGSGAGRRSSRRGGARRSHQAGARTMTIPGRVRQNRRRPCHRRRRPALLLCTALWPWRWTGWCLPWPVELERGYSTMY